MDADDVMKLTRPRRRPRPEVPATPAFKISRPIIITVVLGAIAVIISLILGRV
jgi:hypothetical protein